MMAMRQLDWAFSRQPLKRESAEPHGSIWSSVKNTVDLTLNQRGFGWTWSGNYKPPPHTRPTSSTTAFQMFTLASLLTHYVIADCAHFLIQSTDWSRLTNPAGAPIFDYGLEPIPRYLLSSFNSALAGLTIYCGIQCLYDMSTIVLLVISNYSPLDFPPLFDAPWRATSLADFWAVRWHQLFRRVFIQLGAKPLSFFVGRQSGIGLLGGFVISGILHDWGMWGMAKDSEFLTVGGYFIVQGLGVFLESTVLKKVFGGKLGGWKGWVWTMFWAISWANMFVDAWCRRGLLASLFVPPDYRPSIIIYDLARRVAAI